MNIFLQMHSLVSCQPTNRPTDCDDCHRPDIPVSIHRLEVWSLTASAVSRTWEEISKAHGGPDNATFIDLR